MTMVGTPMTLYEMEAVYFLAFLPLMSVSDAVEAAKALVARDASSGWFEAEQ